MSSEFQDRELGTYNIDQTEANSLKSTELKASRFSPRRILSEAVKYGITGIAGNYSSALLEGVALVGAKLAIEKQIFAGWDPKLAVAALVVSYIPLVHGTLTNAKQAWNTLEEGGVSVSPGAKFSYDVAKNRTSNERVQKIATYIGFSFFEVAKEIPWYVGAFWGDSVAQLAEKAPLVGALVEPLISNLTPTHEVTNEELAYLTGANVFATGYQYAQALAIGGTLRGINEIKKRRKDNYLQKKP